MHMSAPDPSQLNAFVPHADVHVDGTGTDGVLIGTRFAAKDVFDIEGHVTGAGSPDWLSTHAAAGSNAWVIERVLAEGASLTGKTISDELTFGLDGEHHHYGTPINPASPDRIPGGSSSGSASVAAAGVVDFALGTDTAGSVRIPASYCGVFGIRTTHGRVPRDGVFPLAPGFDTVGWVAREAAVLAKVGVAILGSGRDPTPWERLLVATDCLAVATRDVRFACEEAVPVVAEALGVKTHGAVVAPGGLAAWADCFRQLQAREVGEMHGDWFRDANPTLGPGVRERFRAAVTAARQELPEATAARRAATQRVRGLLSDDAVLCMPTAPSVAPLRGASVASRTELRPRILALTSVAGLSGTPQVTIPLRSEGGPPIGLSLIGLAGDDERLLWAADTVASALEPIRGRPSSRG
jgi:amidase